MILKWPHNHNADILNNSVKLKINIYNEFNNIYLFNKSLTSHSNKIYFQASNLVNIILIHIVKLYIYSEKQLKDIKIIWLYNIWENIFQTKYFCT